MLARNLVMKHGQLPVTFRVSDKFGGYYIADQSLYLLYDVILPTGKHFYNWDEDRYHLAQVKVDDFILNGIYDEGETPFLRLAISRARDMIDPLVVEQDWKLRLTDSGTKGYFHVGFAGPSRPHIGIYHAKTNFLWTCFISENSEHYNTIKAQYQAEEIV